MITLKKLLLFAIAFTIAPFAQAMEPLSPEGFLLRQDYEGLNVVPGPILPEGDGVPGPLPNQAINPDALKYARDFGFEVTEEIAPHLDPHDCEKWDKNWAALMAHVAIDHDLVAEMHHEYAVSKHTYPSYETILAMSAGLGNERFCRILIAAGADPNDNPLGATTPLIEAARIGHKSLCVILLEADAEVDARGIEGTTALIEAVRAGHESVCKVLLEAGADVNRAPFNDGWERKTILGLAITDSKKNNEALVRMLLGAGAHVAAADQHNRTALMCAAELKNESMCQLLVDANNGIKTLLGCLKRLKNEHNIIGQVLYTHRVVLLLPYLNYKQYVPTKRLLCMRDPLRFENQRAYDNFQIECLNPMFGYDFPYDPTEKQVDALIKCADLSKDEEKKILAGIAKCAQPDCPLDYHGFKARGRDYFMIWLPPIAEASRENILGKFACELLVNRQQRVNNVTFTALLCMNRLRKDKLRGAELLYRKFKKMLFPHLHREFSYVSLVKLLREITDSGKLFSDIKCLQLQGKEN